MGALRASPANYVPQDTRSNPDPLSEATLQAARLTVCRHATSMEDAADLLAMLGLDGPIATDDAPIEPNEMCRVDNERARARIQHLRDHGVPLAEIAERAGVPARTIYSVLERHTSSARTVERVMSVKLEDCSPRGGKCDRCGDDFTPVGDLTCCRPCRRGEVKVDRARQRLTELHAWAGSWRRVAALVGLDIETMRAIVQPDSTRGRTHIRPKTEARILAVEAPAVTA